MTSQNTSLDPKIAKLLITEPEESRSTVSIYIPKATPLEMKSLGKIFMILEIDSDEEVNEKIISAVQEEIKKSYYGSSDFTIESAFENALKVGNEKLRELISSGLNSWVEGFNALIGVIKDRELHFAQVGHTHAFLVHQQKIVDILENSSGPAQAVNPLKIFSNTISGTLNIDDTVLLCTTSLLDYLSQEKLRRIVSVSPPNRAVKELQVLLEESARETSFAAVILRLAPVEEAAREPAAAPAFSQQPAQPAESMDRLIQKEENTAQLLTPSIWPKVVNNAKSFSKSAASFIRTKVLRPDLGLKAKAKEEQPRETEAKEISQRYTPVRRFTPEKPQTLSRKILNSGKAAGAKALKVTGSSVKRGFSALGSSRKQHGNIRTIPHKTSRGMAKWIIRLKEMSLKQKILLLAAVFLIFLFAFNIVNLGKSEEEKAQHEHYIQNVARAKELVQEADSALIYENEEDARAKLAEAKTLLTEIPDEEADLQEDKNSTLAIIQENSNKVNHVETITDPDLITDLAQTNPNFTASHVFTSGDLLYSLDSSLGLVIQINPEDKETKLIELTGTVDGKIKDAMQLSDSSLLALTEDNLFFEIDTGAGTVEKVSVLSENTDQEIKDISTYLSRLYVLDTKNNQIFRHEKAGQGYASGSAWLEEEVDVKDANSITIDGSVFVAKSNGEIIKLHAGAEADDFSVSQLDPEFSNPTVIKTTPISEQLYLLDPNNKRIVILKKDGSLVKQLFSEKFDNLRDFSVNEDAGRIYLLSGNNIYSAGI